MARQPLIRILYITFFAVFFMIGSSHAACVDCAKTAMRAKVVNNPAGTIKSNKTSKQLTIQAKSGYELNVGANGQLGHLVIDKLGNLGIGTPTPANPLHIKGDAGIRIERTDNTYHGEISYPLSDFVLNNSHPDGKFEFRSNNNPLLTIRGDTSYVGIGTASPQAKLHVSGKILAREVEVIELAANDIKVKTEAWSDYVFDDTYDLPALEKVESYIEKNGHLPDVPSEKEVVAHGVSVSDMLATQMQKIEELTLYLIDQQKKMKLLEQELVAIKKSSQ